MPKLRLIAIGMAIMAIAACAITPPAQVSTHLASTRDTHEKLHGVLWMQTSAEYQTLTRIAYAQAKLFQNPIW